MKHLYLGCLGLLILFCACGHPTESSPSSDTEGLTMDRQVDPKELPGKTLAYTYGDHIYHVHFDSDSTLHWEAMAGSEKGIKADEQYKIAQIAPHMLFITWGEENGIGVNQVLDFEKSIVYNHLLRGRDVSIGTGAISWVER